MMSMGGPFGRLGSWLSVDDVAKGSKEEGGCWSLGFFFNLALSLLYSISLLRASAISDGSWRAEVGSAAAVELQLANYGSDV